jgi:hypothetical protein
MILITPEETSLPLIEDIERLQTNLRGFARDIENLQERVQSGDVTDAETRKVFSDQRSWLTMALETEKALAQEIGNDLKSTETMVSTLTQHAIKSGAAWLACADAQTRDRFLNELSEGELLALPYLFEF